MAYVRDDIRAVIEAQEKAERDHASNLAERVRAAIDQVVLSNFPSPTNRRSLS